MKKLLPIATTLVLIASLILTPAALAFEVQLASSPALTYYTTDSGCQHPFIDLDSYSWAIEEICTLYENGVVEGHSERNFMPGNNITRAEFLKIGLLHLGYVTYAVQSADFTDIAPGDWHYQYITYARSKGFVSGYGDGSFHPNSEITRAEAVTMIMNIAGIYYYDSASTTPFYSDVSNSDWHADAVAMATEHGIIEGYGDGSFRPDNAITRAEAAAIADRIWNYLY